MGCRRAQRKAIANRKGRRADTKTALPLLAVIRCAGTLMAIFYLASGSARHRSCGFRWCFMRAPHLPSPYSICLFAEQQSREAGLHAFVRADEIL
jgi:hypothetical protein